MSDSIGRLAEEAAAKQLQDSGYKILDRNWRRPRCEIDVVAKKDKIVYFVEVKHRSTGYQGRGIDYVTPQKVAQLKFAAANWVAENRWSGDYRLLAASVTVAGSDLSVEDIAEIV